MMVRAKKSLGQHFLTSRSALTAIVTAAGLKKSDTVVEIGPGKGVLTRKLLETSQKVIALEKDEYLVKELETVFAKEINEQRLSLLTQDVLTFDSKKYGLKDTSYKIVANIPYYITGALIEQFLTASSQPASMTLLIQKEVAERIAKSKKESILSLSVKAYGKPHYIKTVSARSFNPPPKVDSAIMHIDNISRDFFSTVPESFFFDVIKAGFSQKRKQLRSNLRNFIRKEDTEEMFNRLYIPSMVRAEDVTLLTWRKIAELILTNRQKTP